MNEGRAATSLAAGVAAAGAVACGRAAVGPRAVRRASDRARAAAVLELLEASRSSPSRLPTQPVVPDDAVTAAFNRIYNHEEWGAEARSGLGSREGTTREFRIFFEEFLRERKIKSIVDAGCGHWPTGYQRFMNWQGVHYTGVDVVQYVVDENRSYFGDAATLQARGLASADCQLGSVCDPLPAADLLLVKDVLMHLPNAAVKSFLQSSIDVQPAQYKMVMLVQNSVPPVVNVREMIDIEPGQLLPFNIAAPPFGARFNDLFRWESDEPKVVQLWERSG